MARYHGTKNNITALGAFVKLLRCADLVSSDIHKHLGQSGLTVSQFGVLEALYHLGPMCQKDLANRILKTAGNITTVITNLEKQGLVLRKRDAEDKRYFSVTLTRSGQELISQIFPNHEQKIVTRMSRLTHEEQITLGLLCKKLSFGE